MRSRILGFVGVAIVGILSVPVAHGQEMTADLANVLDEVYKANPDKAAFCAKGPEGWKDSLKKPVSDYAGGGRTRADRIRDLSRDAVAQISKDCGGPK